MDVNGLERIPKLTIPNMPPRFAQPQPRIAICILCHVPITGTMVNAFAETDCEHRNPAHRACLQLFQENRYTLITNTRLECAAEGCGIAVDLQEYGEVNEFIETTVRGHVCHL